MNEQELADLRDRIAALQRTGKSAEELLSALPELAAIGLRLEQVTELMRRGEEACWACGVRRQRGAMEASLVGGELWWLCDRCQQRRANAKDLGVIWPTDYEAWLKRWVAEQHAVGRDDAWIAIVLDKAKELDAFDPFVVNRMQAVLQAAEEAA